MTDSVPAAQARFFSRWRVALRVARRLVRRAPGRSALIAGLIALPVLTGVFVAVTLRSYQLSPEQAAERHIGAAPAIAVVSGSSRLSPSAFVTSNSFADAPVKNSHNRDAGQVPLPALLPAGFHAVLAPVIQSDVATTGDHSAAVDDVLVDLRDPLTRGIADVTSGSAPAESHEVALSRHLAHELGLRIGGSLTLSSGRSVTISGLVTDPNALSANAVYAATATTFGPGYRFSPRDGLVTWLVDPHGQSLDGLRQRLLDSGVLLVSRSTYLGPPPDTARQSHGLPDPQVVAVVTAIAGFGLLEVILLAGTAFAVGTRRQSRELGLIVAAGGDQTTVRRVVLAQGVVLGAIGAVAGVVLGVVAEIAARPSLERIANRAFGPFDLRPLEVLAVAALGVVSGLIAGIVPARAAARLPVLAMLNERFPVDTGRLRLARWAPLAIVIGIAGVFASSLAWRADNRHYQQAIQNGGRVISPPHDQRWTALLMVATIITLAGLVRSCPWLIARVGRLAGRLPLSARLAIRDAARHRHRSAPAVAAVMTVLAGAVSLLFVVHSTDVKDRKDYAPATAAGEVTVQLPFGSTGTPPTMATAATITRNVAALLPAQTVAVVADAERNTHARRGFGDSVEVKPGDGCDGHGSCTFTSLGIGDAALVSAIAGHAVPQAAAVLARGEAVVTRPGVLIDGRIHLVQMHGRTLQAGLVLSVPKAYSAPDVIVSPAFARAQGWHAVAQNGLILPSGKPTTGQLDRARHVAAAAGGSLSVESGYHGHYGLALIVLVLASGLVTLIGTSIAVALSMAESRSDMSTLAAIGARPAQRRLHAMSQAATVGSIGGMLGIGLGSLVGIGMLIGSTSYPFAVPVRWLLLLAVATPALGMLIAGLATRSRIGMVRRVT